MIDRTHGLSITKQAEALGISRGAVYYGPGAVSAADLDAHAPDRCACTSRCRGSARGGFGASSGPSCPASGRRRIARSCAPWGSARSARNRARVSGTARIPCIRTCSGTATITRPNAVWAMDITYIPMARGFVYLTVP